MTTAPELTNQREALVRVIAAILHFTPPEQQQVPQRLKPIY
jgi:hypothetical protein